jgi:hypothetical protein
MNKNFSKPFHNYYYIIKFIYLISFILLITRISIVKSLNDNYNINVIGNDDSIINNELIFVNSNNESILNLTESQSYLYDRIKLSKYVNNPYSELKLNQSKLMIC